MMQDQRALPHTSSGLFLTDGGLETTLLFHRGVELPHFAAFALLRNDTGKELLRDYFLDYVNLALDHRVGFVLESATWRANADWGERLGVSKTELQDCNKASVTMLQEIRDTHATPDSPMLISGCIGPRGDGYRPSARMSEDEAEAYHIEQIGTFREAGSDMVSAFTLNYPEEAIGIARAARSLDMPVVISFTVETDGRLPSGESLKHAIQRVDEATHGAPAYYMINCAHPSHFQDVLGADAGWTHRIGGIRANASTRSHAELDEAETLDEGDPVQLGADYRRLLGVLPGVKVLGGCCGTDLRHVSEICKACLTAFRGATTEPQMH